MLEEMPKMVDLTLSGRKGRIKELQNRDVRVNIDLRDIAEGTHIISLSDRNIDVPSGVKVERITPRKIQMILTRINQNPEANHLKPY